MQSTVLKPHSFRTTKTIYWLNIFALLLAAMLMVMSSTAEAKRFGGGSFGRQTTSIPQKNTASPTQRNAQNQQAGQQSRKPLGGMLGGLAAGLGLSALFHMLGFSPIMGEMLGTLLLVFLAIMAISFVLRLFRRQTSQLASANGGRAQNAQFFNMQQPQSPFAQGNQVAGCGDMSWGRMEIPAGMDVEKFEEVAKTNFIRLQKAWDAADISSLKTFLTDDLYALMEQRLQKELQQESTQRLTTEIVTLNATLLGVQDLGKEYMASIEFSGMLREGAVTGAQPFTEVWNLTKEKSASHRGWLLAGIQQLDSFAMH